MDTVTLTNALQIIKGYNKPPFDKNDPYWQRKPWQKFGGVSSGICQCWCWYRDDIIMKNTTDEDIEMALKEFGWELTKSSSKPVRVCDGMLYDACDISNIKENPYI